MPIAYLDFWNKSREEGITLFALTLLILKQKKGFQNPETLFA